MTHDERSEVTAYNQPAKWFEITATPEQLRQQHAWKINYHYINATPFIETAADLEEDILNTFLNGEHQPQRPEPGTVTLSTDTTQPAPRNRKERRAAKRKP